MKEPLVLEWAGVERPFLLNFGRVCDLEDACGGVGIGAILKRIGSAEYQGRLVYNTIKFALIGGGMTPFEAQRLMRERFDERPLMENVEVALKIVLTLMEGMPPSDGEANDDPEAPLPFGDVAANFVKAGIAPDALRAMSLRDFALIVQSLRRDGDRGVSAPSEEEYLTMIADMDRRKNGD